ncbi:hypothetical protein DFP72DRAFT_919191 [Ephemerocybe angulata]|uniref:Uncharacterized protein n=1 Tax=Ephemerocybe angulata TaxID=980116 RepID=A0A8H6HIG5_9AGAR|nr:hypothetical protein DFP72DRAFT_919191 [Tulosesus angulatus]
MLRLLSTPGAPSPTTLDTPRPIPVTTAFTPGLIRTRLNSSQLGSPLKISVCAPVDFVTPRRNSSLNQLSEPLDAEASEPSNSPMFGMFGTLKGLHWSPYQQSPVGVLGDTSSPAAVNIKTPMAPRPTRGLKPAPFPITPGGTIHWSAEDLGGPSGSFMRSEPIDDPFCTSAGIGTFTPSAPRPSSLNLLFALLSSAGRGITPQELGVILTRCTACHTYVFIDSQEKHDCAALEGLQAARFPDDREMASYHVLEHLFDDAGGLFAEQLRELLAVCGGCDRVLWEKFSMYHDC